MELRIFHNPFFDREESSVYMPNCKTPPSAFPASPEHLQYKEIRDLRLTSVDSVLHRIFTVITESSQI